MEVMGQYSIKDLEILCGIKAHTLRIWEQRYGLVTPYRTDTNIRYYSDQQLKLVLNIAALNNSGFKISKIANLSPADISKKVLALNQPESKYALLINQLIEGMVELDKQKILLVLQESGEREAFIEFFIKVIFPFLDRVGRMWSSDSINPAQEHFASNIIRRYIIEKIEALKDPLPEEKMFLLFLPEGDWHELSLLVSEYVLKEAGKNVMYLGTSVPDKDIEKIVQVTKIDCLLCVSILSQEIEQTQASIDRFSYIANQQQIVFAGRSFYNENLVFPANCKVLFHFQDLIEL